MENEKDRRMTIMLLPFMSCSAKLPVYGLIAGAFFSKGQGLVVMSLYLLGILTAIGSGFLFKNTLFRGAAAPFVMELPPYRMPTLSNMLDHVWEKVKHFLVKAGTLILSMSVVLWVLLNFDPSLKLAAEAGESILGRLGTAVSPIFSPLGFGAWQAVVALISGFVAKEAVVSSLSVFFGFSAAAGSEIVRSSLSSVFTPLSAYSFLVFVLLYTPCMAAVATMRRELGSRGWTLLVVLFQILIAYVFSLFVYQIGSMLINLGMGEAMASFFPH
jgi:ferrous iron transport protein B